MRKHSFLKSIWFVALLFAFQGFAPVPRPDVKKETETKLSFKGTLGFIMKAVGANKPQRSMEYWKGNKMRSDELDKKGKVKRSRIIDLDKELFINIDHKHKKYTEMTFEQWRDMVKANMEKLKSSESEKPEAEESEPDTELEWKFSVDIDTPGDKKKIAGHRAEKVVLTLKAEAVAKEKTGENSTEKEETGRGGLNVRSINWMVKDAEGYDQVKEFNKRLAEKLGILPGKTGMKEMVTQLMGSNPELAAAIQKLREEGQKLDGVPFLSKSVFETWGESKKKSGEEESPAIPTSVGGLFKKFGKKKKDPSQPTVLLETETKVKKFETSPLGDEVFAIPAGYTKEEIQTED